MAPSKKKAPAKKTARKASAAKKGTRGNVLPPIPPIGAHMSIAGGVDKAVDRAREAGCTALQIFLKNNNQWKGKALDPDVAERYRDEIAKGDLGRPFAHGSYLVNLASADPTLIEKSMVNLLDDLERAETLGVPGVVMHPGAHKGDGEEVGIERIAQHMNELFAQTPDNPAKIYLENTAGQGSAIGHRFEHLRDIIDLIDDKNRVAVCVDTCHLFAAGYDVRTAKTVKATIDEFDKVVGLKWLEAIHINDSKKPLGSRVDRHDHIGKGLIGEAGFAAWLADKRLRHIPHVLETPKSDDLHEDIENLATLRRLAGV